MSHPLFTKLRNQGTLSLEEYASLLSTRTPELEQEATEIAGQIRQQFFGNSVFIRGLIEISSFCKNDCLYCGIRRSNENAQRYRLTAEEILACCHSGYAAGFRTFVLQGGEDAWFTDERLEEIVRKIKEDFPNCAVTLSLGERSAESYKILREAGADRYLLRHEAANSDLYGKLHPARQHFTNRMKCLQTLHNLGFQTGVGFMVGAPFQTLENLAEDLVFIQNFRPEMVGIGPFIPHRDTCFAGNSHGDLRLTLFLLSILRMMLPNVLLPATTALGTIHPRGREMGILAGANVIMPNLSPQTVRNKYNLYDNKLNTGAEAAEGLAELRARLAEINCKIIISRGDFSRLA